MSDYPKPYREQQPSGGGVVLDPFIGSGTTAIAAMREGRHYIGFEINEQYYETAVRRIETEKAKEHVNM